MIVENLAGGVGDAAEATEAQERTDTRNINRRRRRRRRGERAGDTRSKDDGGERERFQSKKGEGIKKPNRRRAHKDGRVP